MIISRYMSCSLMICVVYIVSKYSTVYGIYAVLYTSPFLSSLLNSECQPRPLIIVYQFRSLTALQIDPKRPDTASSSLSKPANVICARCDSLIGMEDIPADGWRLRKSSLAVNPRPENEDSIWETLSVETVVAAQLLELAERESARRFAVHCGERSGLLVRTSPDHSREDLLADHPSSGCLTLTCDILIPVHSIGPQYNRQ